MGAAFDGVRVLDASRGMVGATAAMYFADQGAEVLRLLPPDHGPVDLGPGHLCYDRNKLLCPLDRSAPAGAAELRRLLAAADVAVFDDTPDDLDGAGLDAGSLLAVNPRLVHLWLPLLGPALPWRGLPADPLLADAVTSVSGEHGSYDGHPIALVTPLASYAQGVLGATAAAAALLERHRSGRGQGVTVSGLHAVAAMQAAILTDAEGILRPAQAGGGGASANYHLYRCSDGRWLYLGALTEALFIVALGVLDLLDVLVMPGVDGVMLNLLKPGVGEPVRERMQARFAERPLAEWERLLTEAGVPNAPASTREEWWTGEVIASNGMRRVLDHPDLGTVEVPGDPIRLSRTPGVLSHLPSTKAFVDAAAMWTGPRPDAETPAPAPDRASNPVANRDPATEPDPAVGGGPLAGLRVLDLGSFVAGPFGSSLLTDFGAEVIKIESPDGDAYRAFTVSFLAIHKGQADVVLDLKTNDGLAALHDLIRSADVLLDNVRPGVRERIGTDYARVAAVNPGLVRGTVTAWGVGNELSATPAFDPLLQARSGLIVAQGGSAAPCQSGMLVHDIGTGSLVAFGILAALYARTRDGLGQEVVTTMANSSIMMQAGEFVRYPGRPAVPTGGHEWVGDRALHRLYRCAPGWIALAATTSAQAAAVGRVLGLGPAEPGALLAAPADGPAADEIAGALAGRPAAEAVEVLAAEGVPAAVVLERGGFLTDPWFAASDMLTRIDEPDLGPCTVVRRYADWSRSRHQIITSAPAPGADTDRVLRGAGYSTDRVDGLVASGAARRAAPR